MKVHVFLSRLENYLDHRYDENEDFQKIKQLLSHCFPYKNIPDSWLGERFSSLSEDSRLSDLSQTKEVKESLHALCQHLQAWAQGHHRRLTGRSIFILSFLAFAAFLLTCLCFIRWEYADLCVKISGIADMALGVAFFIYEYLSDRTEKKGPNDSGIGLSVQVNQDDHSQTITAQTVNIYHLNADGSSPKVAATTKGAATSTQPKNTRGSTAKASEQKVPPKQVSKESDSPNAGEVKFPIVSSLAKGKSSAGLKFETDREGRAWVVGIENPQSSEIEIPQRSPNGRYVYGIQSGAFQNCTFLTGIEFPYWITIIGAEAFRGCTSLKSIEFQRGVTHIEDYAFRDCIALKKIEFGQTDSIGNGAFFGCKSLKTLALQPGLSHIAGFAFKNCSSLRKVVFDGRLCDWTTDVTLHAFPPQVKAIHCRNGKKFVR